MSFKSGIGTFYLFRFGFRFVFLENKNVFRFRLLKIQKGFLKITVNIVINKFQNLKQKIFLAYYCK